jgi:hypothetical protein
VCPENRQVIISVGFWTILWEITKVMAPHTAPHVVRAVAERGNRRSAREAGPAQPSAKDLANAISYLENRLSAAEERAATAEDKAAVMEEKLALAEARMADKWALAAKWMLALLAWNAVITGILIYLLFARR